MRNATEELPVRLCMRDGEGAVTIMGDKDDDGTYRIAINTDQGEDLQLADEMVRRYNTHAEMLEALRLILTTHPCVDKPDCALSDCPAKIARAAIAKVRGQ